MNPATPLRFLGITAFLLVGAFGAAAQPLLTWTFTLALFGIPHVLVELQWVGQRYRPTVRPGLAGVVITLLLGLAAFRILGREWFVDADRLAAWELGLGASLVAVVLPMAWRGRLVAGIAAAALLSALLIGILWWPVVMLVTLAFLHNLTPVPMLWDRLRDPGSTSPTTRLGYLMAGLVIFVLIPVMVAIPEIASGCSSLWSQWDLPDSGALRGSGVHDDSIARTVVPGFLSGVPPMHLFRAAAFLQVAHYAAVLGVMPWLGPRQGEPNTRTPMAAYGVGLGLAALFTYAFTLDFYETRAAYGVLAAMHAWVEFPVILLALAGISLTPRRLGGAPHPG